MIHKITNDVMKVNREWSFIISNSTRTN